MAKANNNLKQVKNIPANAKPIPDFFGQSGNKAPLLLLTLLILISFFVFKNYLLQEQYYLFKGIGSDTTNGFYPYYYRISEYITKHGLPGWSFNMGMGRSLFPFILQDPFSIILYAAGKDHIMSGMVYKELAKIISGGMIFFYYLRLLKLSDFTAMIGALFFAFGGFMIVGSFWYIFSFEAFNFALLLLSFELLFTKGKWYLFPVAVFLFCISQPVNLYVYGVFLALYAVLRLFQTGTFSARNMETLFMKMIFFSIIGILLSGPFLLENINQLINSPRVGGANSLAETLKAGSMFALTDKYQLGTCLLRFFSNDIAGTGQYWEGWWNYLEAPEYYCGLPCLLLMPQVFGFLERRVKIVFIVFISIWFIGLIFPYFRSVFWLFSGQYYRAYSFFGAFCFLFFSLLALDLIIKYQKINVTSLLISLGILFFVLLFPFFPPKEQLLFPDQLELTQPLFVFAGVALLVYAAVLYFMSREKSTVLMKYIFFVLVIVEIAWLSQISVNNMEQVSASELSKDYGYDDHQQDAVNYIKQHDHSFFRIDKACYSSPARPVSFNDGLVQDYKGTSVYHSFNQLYYVLYMQLMEVINKANESESRWVIGTVNRPVLESENSVKYILTKKFRIPFWGIACDSIATFGDVTVLRNKYVLPLGFTYRSFIKESVFTQLSPSQKDLVSMRACVVKDEDAGKAKGLMEFNLRDTIAPSAFNTDVYGAYMTELKKDTMTLSRSEDNYIGGNINLSENKMMYLSIPYDKGWELHVDGRPEDKIILSAGMTGVMLPKGEHTIEMHFELPFLRKGLWLSILGIIFYAGLYFYRDAKGFS